MSVACAPSPAPYAWVADLTDDELRALSTAVLSERNTRFRVRRPDSITSRLAGMKVGDTILLEGVMTYPHAGQRMVDIRKRLGEPAFKISARMTNRGVRVRRIA